ncbi:MAG: DUF72 domain-containing protein [Burkholderiaceae bacterium]
MIKSGRFYPKGCNSADKRLRYYAENFPLVEVSSSYYGLPSVANSELWAQRTPSGFTFNIKAFRLFTGHKTEVRVLPPPVRDHLPPVLSAKKSIGYRDVPEELLDLLWQFFIDALQPLQQAGKLGLVHFQFTPSLTYSEDALEYVTECRRRMSKFAMSTEFRHYSWLSREHCKRTLEFEREHDLVHTVVDAPQGFANTVRACWEVTHPGVALVRLHGRNKATWNSRSGSASDRFNYDYSDDELGELTAPIEMVAGQAPTVHVIFNNNYEDQGQRNAQTLTRLLRSARVSGGGGGNRTRVRE